VSPEPRDGESLADGSIISAAAATRSSRLGFAPSAPSPSLRHAGRAPGPRARDGPFRSGEQRSSLPQHFGHDGPRGPARELGVPCPPIQAPDLIRQHDTRDRAVGRKGDLERVLPDPRRHRTQQCDARAHVVIPGTHDEGGSPALLLVTGLRRELEPDQIAALWRVRCDYHASSPCDSPQSASG